METRVIVAQMYTTKKNVQGWIVGITGESKPRMFLHSAAKAIRFAFVLKKQTGLNISQNCLDRLSYANKVIKDMEKRSEKMAESCDYYFGEAQRKLAEIESRPLVP